MGSIVLKLIRHAREGGHPRVYLKSINTKRLFHFYEKNKVRSWMPAFAGMTIFTF